MTNCVISGRYDNTDRVAYGNGSWNTLIWLKTHRLRTQQNVTSLLRYTYTLLDFDGRYSVL